MECYSLTISTLTKSLRDNLDKNKNPVHNNLAECRCLLIAPTSMNSTQVDEQQLNLYSDRLSSGASHSAAIELILKVWNHSVLSSSESSFDNPFPPCTCLTSGLRSSPIARGDGFISVNVSSLSNSSLPSSEYAYLSEVQSYQRMQVAEPCVRVKFVMQRTQK